MMNRHELAAVRKRALNLHLDDHLRHVVHHIGASEQLSAEVHQLGDRAPIANELEHLRANQRDRFRIVQANAACESFLRQIAGLMKGQLVELLRREMHQFTTSCSRDRRPGSGKEI